jgi:hypothetical protein
MDQQIKKMKNVVITLFVLAAYLNVAHAQKPAVVVSGKPGWHKIGEIAASFHRDKESIAVLGKDEFKSVKFKTTDAPINIQKVTVNYESGQSQDIEVNQPLTTGAETKSFDLTNPEKDIKNVTFTYKTMPSYKSEKAHIELYGYK